MTATRSKSKAWLVASVVCAGMFVSTAVAITPPPGTPDLSMMVLQPADFSSTMVTSEGYQKPEDFVAVYSREFGTTVTQGGAQFIGVYSEVDLETDVESASLDAELIATAVRSKSFRNQLAKDLAKSSKDILGVKATRRNVHFGRVRSLHVGQDSVLLPVTLRVKKRMQSFDIAFFRVNRALADLTLIPPPGVLAKDGDVVSVAASMVADMKLGLSPTPTSLPAIAGTPSPGVALSVLPGTWLNNPSSFAYQWERCDATGANCIAIGGQTGLTYTVTQADVGSTIRVAVVATNTVGSSKPLESVPTAVVH